MKRVILTMLCALATLAAMAQGGEVQLNREYQASIREWLEQDVANREATMCRRAEQMLLALPNDEKLYDEGLVTIKTRIEDVERAEGTQELDYVFDISYNCKHAEGYTDDYPLGEYVWDRSNSVRAICRLTKMFVDGVLSDIFREGKEVTVRVTSTTDGTDISAPIAYGGEYGDFKYMPTVFNDEPLRISVSRTSGIANNAQLAYIRAQSVRDFLEKEVRNLGSTHNRYEYITRSYSDTGAHYRRSSIELRVRDAFRETVDLMTADKIQDDYVDFNIPKSASAYEDAYVLIICNDTYDAPFMPAVPYAANDAAMVQRYFIKALGVPERQVKMLRGASKEAILNEGVHWLTDLSQAVAVHKGDALEPKMDIFIYYVGHGYLDYSNVAYIVPNSFKVDGIKSLAFSKKGSASYIGADGAVNYDIALSGKESARLTKEFMTLDELLGKFKGFPIDKITMIVDASFDGNQRTGAPMLRADRKVDNTKQRKRRKINLRSDAVVLLAADFDRTAFSFDTQHHGFLTYFLLKEIKGAAGRMDECTYGEIYDAVERKLNKESALQGRWQEAGGVAGGKFKDRWRDLKLIR